MVSQSQTAVLNIVNYAILEHFRFFIKIHCSFCIMERCGSTFLESPKPLMSQKTGESRLIMKKAVILAAGDSTRMLPLSANQPKHLLPIAGKPLIFHTLEALQKAGITEVLIIYGYHKEKLSEAIDSQDWGKMTVSYVHQEERKGTAHAAGFARDFIGDDSSILMNGDILMGPESFEGLIAYHKKGNYEMTLSVRPVEDPSAYGVVVVEDGKAVKLIEKPTKDQMLSNLVNAGPEGLRKAKVIVGEYVKQGNDRPREILMEIHGKEI